MQETSRDVVVGVDTHQHRHHAVLIDTRGVVLADRAFPATGPGYRQLLAWAKRHGSVVKVGVEGTGSYGAGLATYLHQVGVSIVEVTFGDRQQRRLRGKTDQLDALHAARAVLSGQAHAVPKPKHGATETIRILHGERRLIVKQNTETMNALHALIITAPEPLRARLRDHTTPTASTSTGLARACTHLRARHSDDDLTRTLIQVLHRRATAWLAGRRAARDLLEQLRSLIAATNPALLAVHGVGPDSAAALLTCVGEQPDRISHEAAFAQLAGVAPIPASSGQTHRHRLNRGGDRQANAALHRISIVRLKTHPETRAYRDKALARGKTRSEALRLLKRYLARRLYPILTNPHPSTA